MSTQSVRRLLVTSSIFALATLAACSTDSGSTDGAGGGDPSFGSVTGTPAPATGAACKVNADCGASTTCTGGFCGLPCDFGSDSQLTLQNAGILLRRLAFQPSGTNRAAVRTKKVPTDKSFSTFFTTKLATNGYGLAFVVHNNDQAPASVPFPSATQPTGARFVYVELDTHRDLAVSDPSGNHVGIDIDVGGSVASRAPAFTMAGKEVNVWIDYIAPSTLSVYLAEGAASVKPQTALVTAAVNLPAVVGSSAFVGFVAPSEGAGQPSVARWNVSQDGVTRQCGGQWGLGEPADATAQCSSKYLADGVCCLAACEYACSTCLASKQDSGGRSGYCLPVKLGTDPDEECTATDAASCGTTGMCGLGGCQLFEGNNCNAGSLCNLGGKCGNGTCRGATPKTCAAPATCQEAGVCEPTTGECTYASKLATCDDGSALTTLDRCVGGVCGGLNPVSRAWVASAASSACGLKSDGTLQCWGYAPSPPAGTFKRVDVATGYACAIKSDDTLQCWGTATGGPWGQLTPPSGTFTELVLGYTYGCALKSDGAFQCWGKVYTSMGSGFTYAQLDGAWSHACGITLTGAVKCWGNYTGPGQNDPPADLQTSNSYVQVSAGDSSSCALKNDGTVRCWGGCGEGICTPPANTYFTYVSVGAYHACGLKPNGEVACWGNGAYGVTTPPAGPFLSLTAGSGFSCGVKADRSVKCWGDNRSGAAPSTLQL